MASLSWKKKLKVVEDCAVRDLDRSYLHGFLACFSVEELCQAAIYSLDAPISLRTAVRSRLRRLASDGIGLAQLDELAAQLMNRGLTTKAARIRTDALLSYLYTYFSPPTRKAILEYWRDQATRSAMSRWLKAMSQDTLLFDIYAIVEHWQRTEDSRAAAIISARAFPDALTSLLSKMAETAPGWIVSRAALRATAINEDAWMTIRRELPATYAYLCAKSGRSVSDHEAVELILAADQSDRGLAVWSVGQMGKWAALARARNKVAREG